MSHFSPRLFQYCHPVCLSACIIDPSRDGRCQTPSLIFHNRFPANAEPTSRCETGSPPSLRTDLWGERGHSWLCWGVTNDLECCSTPPVPPPADVINALTSGGIFHAAAQLPSPDVSLQNPPKFMKTFKSRKKKRLPRQSFGLTRRWSVSLKVCV